MNKKIIKNAILFTGIAGVSATAYMVNTEAKTSSISINAYVVKSQVVDIPDANLKKGINNTLGRGEVLNDITIADMESLESLSLTGKNISNIDGIQFAINLTSLNLNNNQISDISILANLTKLTRLELQNNQIKNTSGLEHLSNLTTLWLHGNQISDISALESLTSLTGLSLNNNQISDISSLKNLTNLTTLHLYSNNIFDISYLESLVQLVDLQIQDNQISDISSLDDLTKLNILYLGNNKVSNIQILDKLINLKELRLGDNNISNIYSLKNLINLTKLQLQNNPILNIIDLKDLVKLTNLQLNNNQISDISSLKKLTNLTYLYLYDNQIEDISVLKELVNLKDLRLQNNQILDISHLNNLTKLNTLYLTGQKISNDYVFKTNTQSINISIDNLTKGLNSENISATSISNSGRYENGKFCWDNVTLGEKAFTSNFNQTVQINTAKTTFSGTVTYNIEIVDGEGPIVDNNISINEEDFTISATITTEGSLYKVDYLIHRGERHDLPYTFNYDVFNKENNIVQVYDMVGNMTEYEVTADLLDLDTINSLVALLEENDNSPEVISYIRAIINNMSESANKDLLNDKINNLSFDMTLDRLTTSANVDIYIKCENLLSMTLDTNMITFENYSSAEDMEKSEAITIAVNSSLPYQLNAYLPTEIQNADGTKTLDKSIFNIKESSEDEYKKFTSIGGKVILKDNCEKGNDLMHLIDLKLSSDSAHDADVYKTTIKFEIEQK